MKRLFSYCLALALAPCVLGQPADFWVNDGIINAPPDIIPQIDAINFVNNNTITINTLGLGIDDRPLFDTSDTLNFTNRGVITVNTGLRFDTEPATIGYARWAANFDNTGVINSGTDTNFVSLFFFPTTTYVSSTNLVSHGTFNMGFESVLHLSGSDIDLSRGLVTMQNSGLVSGNLFFTTNALSLFNQGFLDGYWGLSTNVMDPAAQFETVPAFEPFSLVTDRNYLTRVQQLGGLSYLTYLNDFTDNTGSNRFVRAVFLNNTNSAVTANVFLPAFGDIEVEWITSPAPGVTNFIYLFDDFGLITNFQLIATGLAGPRPTFTPVNYTFFTPGFQLLLGPPEASTVIPPGTFIPGAVTNQYSAYEALFLPTTRGLNDTPGQNITNTAGRVEISATNFLDLTLSRVTANNYILLNATNQFGGSIGSRLVSPFYDLNLRSTNGTFVITNIIIPRAPKEEGTIELYSARWTNFVAGVTNRYHVLFVNTQFAPTSPTREQDVILHSTNTFGGGDSIILNDILRVTRNLLLDTTALTIATNDVTAENNTGGIQIQNANILWPTSTPRLQYLTNFGFIETSNAVFFGGSRSSPFFSSTFDEPYKAFVNIGTVTNFGSLIWADYFLNAGTFSANNNGSVDLRRSQNTILTNGAFLAPGGDISIATSSLLVSNHVFIAGRSITLAVTNFLDDGSLLSSSADLITNKNAWIGSGFNILVAPAQGNLLGTTISNSAAPFQRVLNVSAAADRGCGPEGFVNNAAVGRMILDGGLSSLFEFAPASGGNALYIDSLELVGFTATNRDLVGNFAPGLLVDPGMKVYFAQALANGASVAEKLNGLSGGRLCWVSNFNCGFFSSTNLIYPGGATNRVNTALAQSCDIDSNGNGIPNCMDPAPIPGGGCNLAALAVLFTNVPPSTGGGGDNGGGNTASGLPTLDFPSANGGSAGGAYPLAKVSYNGLFYEMGGVAAESSGYFTLKTTDNRGGFSASLVTRSGKRGFSGRFDAAGHFSGAIAKSGLSVNLQWNVQSADQLQGTVSDGHWTANILADRQAAALARAGNYTFAIPGTGQNGSTPGGYSIGTASVDASGTLKWTGTLADGTKVTQSSAMSKQGIWPLYAPLSGGGVVISWVQFSNQQDSDLRGELIWMKPANAMTKYYPLGFTNDVMAKGSSYQAPMAGTRAIKLTQGNLTFTGGGLHTSMTSSLTLGLNNRVTVPVGTHITLTITPSTGLFKGTALNPDTGKNVSFQGVLFKKTNVGVGYFLGAGQAGEVYLSPAQ